MTSAEQRETRWSELMALSQKGDRAAYSKLLDQLYPYVKTVVTRKVGSLGATDDLTQECLIAVHQARHTYDPRRKIRPWILAIIRYKIIDFFRKSEREYKREIAIDQLPADTKPPHVTNNGKQEASSLLRYALAGLKPEFRRAVELTLVGGLSTQEAAEHEKISPQALRTRISRAYKIMRKRLEAEFEE